MRNKEKIHLDIWNSNEVKLNLKKQNNNNFSILLDNFTKLDSTSDI